MVFNAFLFLVMLAAACPFEAKAISIVDDFGDTVHLDRPAGRIICLYGALNEIVMDMGGEDLLIARTNADGYLPGLKDKPSIGTHMRPSLELVAGLKPDLVLQMSGRKQASESLRAIRDFGIPVALFKAESLDGVFSIYRRIGKLTGLEHKAEDRIMAMERQVTRIHAAIGVKKRAKVFFEVRYPNLLASGKSSIVTDIINRAGGINCVNVDKKLVRMSEEELIRLNPDYYLYQKGPMNPNPVPPQNRPHFKSLKAVKSGQVYLVDEKLFSRPGPGTIKAIAVLAAILHPEIKNEIIGDKK